MPTLEITDVQDNTPTDAPNIVTTDIQTDVPTDTLSTTPESTVDDCRGRVKGIYGGAEETRGRSLAPLGSPRGEPPSPSPDTHGAGRSVGSGQRSTVPRGTVPRRSTSVFSTAVTASPAEPNSAVDTDSSDTTPRYVRKRSSNDDDNDNDNGRVLFR